MDYIRNEQLETILPGWKGNALDADGRFINAYQPFKASFSKVLRWQLTRNPQKAEKVAESWKLRVRTDGDFLKERADMLTWLGHATFLIRLEGITFLTDPVFFRASPLVRRLCELPAPVSQLQGIDYVLLSHGHMDHCDEKSLRLLAKGNPRMEVLTGLKMDSLIVPWLLGRRIQQAGWYQEYQLGQTGIRVFFLPARHWYKRTWNDDNRRLWGSFVIQTPRLTLYFSGDTGYDSHFQETAKLFPQPDVCLMGVGAYSPAFMMQENHMNPEEAVRSFNEMNGKTFIPMHYGTYDLSDEPLGEPVRWLQQLEKDGKINGRMKILDVGEIFKL